jgi:DNA polymerase-3 subunit epsilon
MEVLYMREIVLDTETTGLSPNDGHRIVEIGCVELIDGLPTTQVFQVYINPERDVPLSSTHITGLTYDFLAPFPTFINIVGSFLDFIKDSKLVIHNAPFDIGFLNAELKRANKPLLELNRVIDTLELARKQLPGASVSLNALCKRYKIDLKMREKHGALLDAKLLAQVYLELYGGRQRTFVCETNKNKDFFDFQEAETKITFPKRIFELSELEKNIHQEFLKKIKNPLWDSFRSHPM